MPTVAKGQIDLEVNKDQVTKDVSGLSGPLSGVFGKLGATAGTVMGIDLGAALGKVTGALPGGPLGAVATGVAVGAVAIGASLFTLGQDFDKAYKQIQKQTGATGDEFDKLKGSFKEVAKSTGASFEDIATSVGTVSQRTGATGAELDKLSLSMLRMSSITGKDLNTVIDSSTKLFNNWQIPVDQMPASMDKLYVASAKTGVGVDKLAATTQTMGPILRQFGYGFDDSVALMASFDQAGVNTSKVTSGMSLALGKLAKQGEKDVPKAFGAFVDSINAAGTQAEASSIAVDLLGTRAGPQFAEAIRSGAFSVGELSAQLGGAEGALGKTAAETATFSQKLAKFKNQMKVAFEPAAMGLFTSITDALIMVTPMLTAFATLTGKVIGFLTQNKVILLTVVGAFTAFAVVLGVVTIATILSTTAFGAMAIAVLAATWPILAIIAGIALLVIGITLLYTKVDWFRKGVDTAFKGVTVAFNWVLDTAKAVFSWISANWPKLVPILLLLLGPIGIVLAAVFVFRDQIGSAISAVIGFFTALPGRVTAALGSLASGLVGVASSAMGAFSGAISGGIGAAVAAVGAIPGQIVGALGNLGRLLFDAGANIINGLVEGIKSKVGAVTGAIGDVASKIRGALPFSPAKWGPLSGRGNPLYSGQAIGNLVAAGMHDTLGAVTGASAELAGAAAVGAGGAYDFSGVARAAGATTGAVDSRLSPGPGGPAVLIEHAEFNDNADVEVLMRQTEFAVTAGRL